MPSNQQYHTHFKLARQTVVGTRAYHHEKPTSTHAVKTRIIQVARAISSNSSKSRAARFSTQNPTSLPHSQCLDFDATCQSTGPLDSTPTARQSVNRNWTAPGHKDETTFVWDLTQQRLAGRTYDCHGPKRTCAWKARRRLQKSNWDLLRPVW